jgi:penicillin-binding protein 1B
VFLAVALASLLGAAWGWMSSRYTLPDSSALPAPTVRLYAGHTEIAAFQGASRRFQVWIPLEEIPQHVVDAVLIAEDRRFFLHRGIDLLASLRAALADLRHLEVRQGGSTITQQLARTLFLSHERSWGRKLRELAIALFLESRYPKARILEAYLNSVYLGHDGDIAVYGMGAAARRFLGKDLAAVRLDEAALLSAAIRSPNRLLSGDRARAQVARDGVLEAMRRHGMAGEAAIREALRRPVGWRATASPLRAPYFVDLAREEIARRIALPPGGEVRIATSLDPALQRMAERAIQDGVQRAERRQPGLSQGRLQAALVAIEPSSGHIRALVGGRRYLDGPYNRAVRAARQPGSLFKPIVYLAAFEADPEGRAFPLTPASLILDEPFAVQAGTGVWIPRNMTRRFHGPVTVRRALEESLNVPTVRVAQELGVDRVIQTARRLGIRSPLPEVPSLALGTAEVTLLEITSAFATLANQGVRTTPTTLATEQDETVTRITSPLPPAARAASAESSFMVTHILRGVMRHGTGRSSAGWGLEAITAGKTGSSDGLRDAWFVGYTPDLAVGVWLGLDDGRSLGLTGAQSALPVWAAVMQAAVRRAPPKEFAPPPGIVFASVDRHTGQPAPFWCGGGDRLVEEAFRAGTEPSGGCQDVWLAAYADGLLSWIRALFR